MLRRSREGAGRAASFVILAASAALVACGPASTEQGDAQATSSAATDATASSSPPTPTWLVNPVAADDVAGADFVVAEGPSDPNAPELDGAAIYELVAEIVRFSHEDRANGSQLWGRISGRPAAAATAEWVDGQFREAGLQSVEVQEFPASDELWFPHSWRVKVLEAPGHEPAGDWVLASAVPTAGSFILGETLTAPVVDVGVAGESRAGVDVEGKIAVQAVSPERSAYTARTLMRETSQSLISDGAVAVINVVNQAHNMHVYDFGGCGGACFNLGTDDGTRLIERLWTAEDAGAELMVELTLDAENLSGLTAHNVVGIVPGRNYADAGDEVVIVNAHLDGWFDGAGDNADGLAVLIALARYYGAAETPPARTMAFVASAGHHSRGLNGPSNFVAMNPGLAERAVLVLNLEHVAQYEVDPVTWEVYPREQPMSFGISNMAPFLVEAAREAQAATGFALIEEYREAVPGDLGGYASLGVPRVQAIHSGALYHTSGDVLETISVEGLTRAAAFYRRYLDAVLEADAAELEP